MLSLLIASVNENFGRNHQYNEAKLTKDVISNSQIITQLNILLLSKSIITLILKAEIIKMANITQYRRLWRAICNQKY